jgi:hypothetical protein
MTRKRFVTLYHFTCKLWLPDILREGITRGDVPLSLTESLRAPNLTDDPDPSRQRWCEPPDGRPQPDATDKTKVRLTVQVRDDPARLVRWSALAARLGVDPEWYGNLARCGGSEHWWVHLGTVSPHRIVKVEVRDADGWRTVRPDEVRRPEGYEVLRDASGKPVRVRHPDGRLSYVFPFGMPVNEVKA